MKDKIKQTIQDYWCGAGECECSSDGSELEEAFIRLFQAQREQDIKAFEEMIPDVVAPEDVNYRSLSREKVAVVDAQFEIVDELRTKLDQYKKENI